jgi:hypothetical protein
VKESQAKIVSFVKEQRDKINSAFASGKAGFDRIAGGKRQNYTKR